MKYVVDASIGVKWELIESDTQQARRLRDDFRAGIHELSAPDVFPVEVAHALTRAERKRLIPQGQADLLLAQVLSVGVRFHSYRPLLRRAVAIASKAHIGVYDCLYLILAEDEQCEFVTTDQRLINAFPGRPIKHLSQV